MSQNQKNPDDVETTGHSWDGIEEFDNPMPRWWLWTFYATIFWAVLYTIAYPAWPLISQATPGLLGYSTRGEVAEQIALVEENNAAINEQLASVELTEIAANSELGTYAENAGGSIFATYCSQCHGSGAAGAVGYPSLLDDDWLWGGDIENIYLTIAHGIRNDDLDSRYSEMPAFGDILEDPEIDQLVNYVISLSGTPEDAAMAAAGEELFLDNCSSCHGEDGKGDVFQGAPNLADAIWLYGGDPDTLRETITYSRFGVMPPWNTRLSEAELRAVSHYVHTRGGGE
ncbi:cytochrome-c oxidase, cbb3-type subunit III [Parasulfitobacter algicola]|uniref:Cbb3-type cytochrome c oxidase subunit n=1 Tax=Parasulfitobacter algicola TaxID=2614809 RepID=A0ABX2IPS2_9RHOB|nr:cytochrome-c oxidase, cbb3-type subunit III [Sulfitobacter algicola]NSX54884.1 cytochrome-c oxidase, cbb3-type subunit III [Sulfitobacter algicola]